MKKILAAGVLVFLCVLTVNVSRHFFLSDLKWIPELATSLRSAGNRAAPIHVVEYFDYQCPSCRTASSLLHEYLNNYPSSIYIEVHFYPLFLNHHYAMKTALYAQCAARQEKFWQFHNLLFGKQAEWSQAKPDKIDSLLTGYAKSIGINFGHLEACLQDPKMEEEVMKEMNSANSMGIRSTPSFFINGQLAVGTKGLKEALDKLVADLLQGKNKK